MIEQQPVPGIMRAGSTPAATSSSSIFKRSCNDSEFASLFVPNTASPQFCDSSHLQCAMNRWLSGARSLLNGVTTGASTPRMHRLMISHQTSNIEHQISRTLDHGFSFKHRWPAAARDLSERGSSWAIQGVYYDG